jgi:hypothetical protein
MFVVLCAVSLTSGMLFKKAQQDNFLIGFGEVVCVSAGSFAANIPVFAGVWYGLFSAQRLKVTRPAHRLGLMLVGCCAVAGAAALPVAILLTAGLIRAGSDAHFVRLVIIFWSITPLCLPAVFIERRCKLFEAERRAEGRKRRAAQKSKEVSEIGSEK